MFLTEGNFNILKVKTNECNNNNNSTTSHWLTFLRTWSLLSDSYGKKYFKKVAKMKVRNLLFDSGLWKQNVKSKFLPNIAMVRSSTLVRRSLLSYSQPLRLTNCKPANSALYEISVGERDIHKTIYIYIYICICINLKTRIHIKNIRTMYNIRNNVFTTSIVDVYLKIK